MSDTACNEVRLVLSAMIDKQATPEETAHAKAHMAHCEACTSHYAFLRLTHSVLASEPREFPATALSARIAAATYARPTFADKLRAFFAPAPATRLALGTALTAGIIVAVVSRMTGPVTPEMAHTPHRSSGDVVQAPAPEAGKVDRGASQTNPGRTEGTPGETGRNSNAAVAGTNHPATNAPQNTPDVSDRSAAPSAAPEGTADTPRSSGIAATRLAGDGKGSRIAAAERSTGSPINTSTSRPGSGVTGGGRISPSRTGGGTANPGSIARTRPTPAGTERTITPKVSPSATDATDQGSGAVAVAPPVTETPGHVATVPSAATVVHAPAATPAVRPSPEAPETTPAVPRSSETDTQVAMANRNRSEEAFNSLSGRLKHVGDGSGSASNGVVTASNIPGGERARGTSSGADAPGARYGFVTAPASLGGGR